MNEINYSKSGQFFKSDQQQTKKKCFIVQLDIVSLKNKIEFVWTKSNDHNVDDEI